MRASLDPQPLLDLIRDRFGDATHAAAEAIGVAPRSIQRWAKGGGVAYDRVDDYTIRLGHHPRQLWPEYLDLALKEAAHAA